MNAKTALAFTLGAVLALLAGAGGPLASSPQREGYGSRAAALPDYAALLAAPDRSDADKARDAARKPAEVLAKVKAAPGMVVIDLGSGGGYYAGNFARAVAPEAVHAVNDPLAVEQFPQILDSMATRLATPSTANIRHEIMDLTALPASWQADVAFLGEYYHDIAADHFHSGLKTAAVNAAVFNALKPGGLYVIEDHIAKADANAAEVGETLHRVPPQTIRDEVLAAGFELVEENFDLFANPDDPLTILVFDPSIRGKTARVLYIFRKPAN